MAGCDVRLALGHLGEGSPDVERHRLPTYVGLQGTGPSSAQSTLQMPGPYRKCSSPRR